LTTETSTLWLDAWTELAETHGLDLVRDSLQRHCRTQRYLPLPADVRDGVETIMQERAAAAKAAAGELWTVERYRTARDFDVFLTEQIEAGKLREEVLKKFPGLAPTWIAWSNQRAAGTLRCPGWCERCSGDKLLFGERDGRRYARPCPSCCANKAA
jgi:hypothetical protein